MGFSEYLILPAVYLKVMYIVSHVQWQIMYYTQVCGDRRAKGPPTREGCPPCFCVLSSLSWSKKAGISIRSRLVKWIVVGSNCTSTDREHEEKKGKAWPLCKYAFSTPRTSSYTDHDTPNTISANQSTGNEFLDALDIITKYFPMALAGCNNSSSSLSSRPDNLHFSSNTNTVE